MEKTEGWHEFHIDIGKQYPVKIDTKLPELIEQGRGAGREKAVWTYKQQNGAPNPKRPGEFFKNRRFQSVEVGGQITITDAPKPGASSGAGSPDADRNSSIERQVIIKAAMLFYPANLIKTDADFFALIARLDAFAAGKAFSGRQGAGYKVRSEAEQQSEELQAAAAEEMNDIPF